MKIFCVVLSFNSAKYISNCIESLLKVNPTGSEFEILLVDNASSDNSVEFLKRKYPRLTLIESAENLGYAEGNNLGIRYALDKKADFVWIVNPDVVVAPDSLKFLLEAAARFPRGGIFGSKLYFTKGYEFHKERYSPSQLGKVIWYAGGIMDWANMQGVHRGVDLVDNGQFDFDCETDFVTGASMFVRSQVFSEIGVLDKNYFLYYEENDFCQKAKSHFWKLIYVAKSVGWHANAQATGIGSPLQDYYITRNRLMFGLRYAPDYTKLLLIKQSIYLFFYGRPWQKRGVIDFYTRRLGAGSYQPG